VNAERSSPITFSCQISSWILIFYWLKYRLFLVIFIFMKT